MEKMTSKEVIQTLFQLLRKNRPFFHANDYKWKLGIDILKELGMNDEVFQSKLTCTVATLYGIDIEIDYLDPRNIRLFEDITNKL